MEKALLQGRRPDTLKENKNLPKKVKKKGNFQPGENGTEVSKQIGKGGEKVENEINVIPHRRRKGKVICESIDEVIEITQVKMKSFQDYNR